MINSVDEFILYDDVQFTKRDWRNRNTIKTPQGILWLTLPVKVKGRFEQKIKDTLLDGESWGEKHFKIIQQNYKRSSYYDEIISLLEPVYRKEKFTHLSKLNQRLLQLVCDYLGITTHITSSADYHLVEGKTERLVNICLQAGATEYISGPAAKSYIDMDLFNQHSIEIKWFSYSGYLNYQQLWGDFIPNVSILDLLFNCGKKSSDYLCKTASVDNIFHLSSDLKL